MTPKQKARKKYEKKIRESPEFRFENNRKQTLRNARTHIRRYATVESLDELDLLIKEKRVLLQSLKKRQAYPKSH